MLTSVTREVEKFPEVHRHVFCSVLGWHRALINPVFIKHHRLKTVATGGIAPRMQSRQKVEELSVGQSGRHPFAKRLGRSRSLSAVRQWR